MTTPVGTVRQKEIRAAAVIVERIVEWYTASETGRDIRIRTEVESQVRFLYTM